MEAKNNAMEHTQRESKVALPLLNIKEDPRFRLEEAGVGYGDFLGFDTPFMGDFLLEENNSIFDFSEENDKGQQTHTTLDDDTSSFSLSDHGKEIKVNLMDLSEHLTPVHDPIKQEQEKQAKALKLRLKKLNELSDMMSKLINSEVDELCLSSLDPVHFSLFKEMLLKKLKYDSGLTKLLNNMAENTLKRPAAELMSYINGIIAGKRKEEILKFCFKQTLTHLKRKMGVPYKGLDIKDEISFWRHYFEKSSKSKGIPLDHYFDPLNSRRIKNSGYKNLSKAYLALLFSEESFRRDFTEYLES